MVDCLSCGEDGTKTLRIVDISYNRALVEGDKYTITVSYESNTWLLSLYGRICLFESGTLVAESGSVKIGANQQYSSTFTGTMLDRDMLFKLSLQYEEMGFIELCMDARDFTIIESTVSEVPTDPTDPYNDVSTDTDIIATVENYMGDLFGENTIMIMVLGVAVILIILIARK